MATLTSVDRTTLRAQALTRLRDGILSGELPAGSRLGEVDLAARLGVSRGTVREALRTLQQGGLVDGVERLGLRVRSLGADEIREVFNVRAALEGQAAVELIAAANPALIDELEASLPPASSDSGYSEYFELDLAFHETLCRVSGNGMLLSMWRSIKDLMRLAIVSFPSDERRPLMARGRHAPIVKAIQEGDPAHAREVIEEHMRIAASKWAEIGGAAR